MPVADYGSEYHVPVLASRIAENVADEAGWGLL
jgi:hypothetical protein